jgi:hypothetical protein
MNWKADAFHLFLSHVSADRQLAFDLSTILFGSFGIECFVAHADIETSADWQNEIESALRIMDAMLALITTGFSASPWCNQELGWALGTGRLVLSVLVNEPPCGFVARSQGVPAQDRKIIEIADRVFSALATNDLTAEAMGVVTARRFRNATSWESIRDDIAPQIRRCKKLNDLALDQIEAAFREAYHVKTSRYVGDIKRLLLSKGRIVEE